MDDDRLSVCLSVATAITVKDAFGGHDHSGSISQLDYFLVLFCLYYACTMVRSANSG
jgi:hypothetical protein